MPQNWSATRMRLREMRRERMDRSFFRGPAYAAQLLDPRWRAKRQKILARADCRCQVCGAERVPLEVHHSFYRSGLMAWEYPDASLIAVCGDCHGRILHGLGSHDPD